MSERLTRLRSLATEILQLVDEETGTVRNGSSKPKLGKLPRNFRKPNGVHLTDEGREWLMSKLRDNPEVTNRDWIALTGLTNIIITKYRDQIA